MQYFIQNLIDIHVCLAYTFVFLTVFRRQCHHLLSDLLVALGKNKCRVVFKLPTELFHNLRLIKVGCFWLVEKGGLLASFDEDELEIVEPFFKQLQVRQVVVVLFNDLCAAACVGVDGVHLSEHNCTELDNELLKPVGVKVLGVSLV